MSDIKGDKNRQPPECKDEWIENKEKPWLSYLRYCPHLENTYGDMDGETYECRTCGRYFNLYYDEMK